MLVSILTAFLMATASPGGGLLSPEGQAIIARFFAEQYQAMRAGKIPDTMAKRRLRIERIRLELGRAKPDLPLLYRLIDEYTRIIDAERAASLGAMRRMMLRLSPDDQIAWLRGEYRDVGAPIIVPAKPHPQGDEPPVTPAPSSP